MSSRTLAPYPAPALLAVLADRTTRCDGGPPPDDAILPHLRVIVSRVLRTGRGPTGLIKWVQLQLADHPPQLGDLASQLAERLHNRVLPPTPAALETLGG